MSGISFSGALWIHVAVELLVVFLSKLLGVGFPKGICSPSLRVPLLFLGNLWGGGGTFPYSKWRISASYSDQVRIIPSPFS